MMNAFDKVIGYDTIKSELKQVCDMINNREVYANLGANLPNGIMLYGDPGLGKTLMAKCFIEESGLKAYIVRRNKASDDFVGEITDIFNKAKENAPAIVFLDDMDKFANEDERHRDAEEYVAVQSGIDEVRGFDVFVLATVNEFHKLPKSLTRSGRFDRKIEVCSPTEKDASEIIKYYLKNKKIASDVNFDNITMMISYSSCAELETILNEAAIRAAFERHDSITMDDLTKVVLRMEYEAPDNYTRPSEDHLQEIALHEAGHLVVCEVLCPGSVGLASIRSTGRDSTGGFIRRCKELTRRPYHILVSLAGKAAVELYHSHTCANGCQADIKRAFEGIRKAISESGTAGFGMIDVSTPYSSDMSENLNSRTEAVIYAELERYMFKARDILLKNQPFLEKAVSLLLEKETLLYSDIRELRESVSIVNVEV